MNKRIWDKATKETKLVKDLQIGDVVDLENDLYADSDDEDFSPFEFEYERVLSLWTVTDYCVTVEFESGFACNFPSEHSLVMAEEA